MSELFKIAGTPLPLVSSLVARTFVVFLLPTWESAFVREPSSRVKRTPTHCSRVHVGRVAAPTA